LDFAGNVILDTNNGQLFVGVPINPFTNEVNEDHTFVLSAWKDEGDGNGFVPAANQPLNFELNAADGASVILIDPTTNECLTDANGICYVTFNSETPGRITARAWMEITIGGIMLYRETDGAIGNSTNGVKTYVDAILSIEGDSTLEVGSTQTFTFTLLENHGDVFGFVPAAGETVEVSYESFNGAVVSGLVSTCDQTDAQGKCTVSFTSDFPGKVVVTGTTNIEVEGLTLTRSTPVDSPGVVYFADASISIGPDAIKEVDQSHTFTIVVMSDSGDGNGLVPISGVTPTFNIDPSLTIVENQCETIGTDSSGECTLTVVGSLPGEVLVAASVIDLPVGATTISRSDTAALTYIDGWVEIIPTYAELGIFEGQTIAITITISDGTLSNVSGVVPAISFPGIVPNLVDTSDCDDGTSEDGSCTIFINHGTTALITVVVSAELEYGDLNQGGIVIQREETAEFQFVAGSISWFKVDGSLSALGGASFDVCRTADQHGTEIPVECVTVIDNTQNDSNPVPGEFLLANVLLGTYSIVESEAPDDYILDDTVAVTVVLSIGQPDATIETPWVNTAQAKLAPTQTTCEEYISGVAGDLTELFYGTQDGLIGSVSPGVFFYYSQVVAPASEFTLSVKQTNDADFAMFKVHKLNQVQLFEADCSQTEASYVITLAEDTVVFDISGAVAGEIYILSIKYSTADIVGEPQPATPPIHYGFSTWIENEEFTRDPDGILLLPR
jgi:hypothetical protein